MTQLLCGDLLWFLCKVPVHTNDVFLFLPLPVVLSLTVTRTSFAASVSLSSARSHTTLYCRKAEKARGANLLPPMTIFWIGASDHPPTWGRPPTHLG